MHKYFVRYLFLCVIILSFMVKCIRNNNYGISLKQSKIRFQKERFRILSKIYFNLTGYN